MSTTLTVPSAGYDDGGGGGDDERRPLLGDAACPYACSTPGGYSSKSDEESGGPVRASERGWGVVVVYCMLMVCGAVALGFLAKRLLDASGVELELRKALKAAFVGGMSGAAAMVLQVLTLMPLRTVMTYQYRYGTTTTQTIRAFRADGGWRRYYQGLAAALVQGPISRFGDTAAIVGILALFQSNAYLRNLPGHVKTVFASLAAATFRMLLTPIDTVKIMMQTQGKEGLGILRARVEMYGITTLWYGAFATAAAGFVGHYPWFATYNFLEGNLPPAVTLLQKLTRRAFIGFMASVVSDTVSNSLRVVKTYRQVSETRIGYAEAARSVIATDGVLGLFGRGLKTRIVANGLQGLMFSVLWKFFLDLWGESTK